MIGATREGPARWPTRSRAAGDVRGVSAIAIALTPWPTSWCASRSW